MKVTATQFGPVTHRWLDVIFGFQALGFRVVELKVPASDVKAIAWEFGVEGEPALERSVSMAGIPVRVV